MGQGLCAFLSLRKGGRKSLSVRADLVVLWSFLAFAVERFVEIIVKLIPSIHKKRLLGIEVPVLLAFFLSLIIAMGTALDFFQVFSIEFFWPCVGYILTALVMTGGSNLTHESVRELGQS